MKHLHTKLPYLALTLLASACSDPKETSTEATQLRSNAQQVVGDPGETWEITGAEVDSENVPQPFAPGPLYACAEAIEVRGTIRFATIRVYDASNNQLGETDSADAGSTRVELTRPLVDGDVLRVEQEVNGFTSPLSEGLTVSTFTGTLPKPVIASDVVDCARLVFIEGSFPGATGTLRQTSSGTESTRLRYDFSDEIAFMHNAGNWKTTQLIQNGSASNGDTVRLRQVMCGHLPETDPSYIASPWSDIMSIMPAPNPVSTPDVITTIGSNVVDFTNTVAGAYVSIFRGSPPNDSLEFNYLIGRSGNQRYRFRTPAETGDTFWATQTLCSTTAGSTPVAPQPVAVIQAKLTGAPELEGPVCEGVQYVRVKPVVPEGRIALYRNGDAITDVVRQVSAGSGEAVEIGLAGVPLAEGDELRVKQFLHSGLSSAMSGPVDVVDNQVGFEVKGAQSYTSQDDGSTLEGFLSETSRGPELTVRECCPTSATQPEKIKAYIYREDAPSTIFREVTLHRQYNGVYTGRWDWFVDDGNANAGAPPGNFTYTATVTTPCQSETLSQSFEVFTTTPNASGDAVALAVTLSAAGEMNSSASTTPISADINADQTINLTAEAVDRDGIETLEILATPSGPLNSPTSKVATLSAPLPEQLTLNTSIDGLLPTESITLTARAKNFGSSTWTTTGAIVLTAEHEDPVIFPFADDEIYSADGLDIQGKHLFYPNLTTTVKFDCGTITASTTTIANPDKKALVGVEVPSALQGKGQLTCQVTVTTSIDVNGTTQTKSSNAQTLTIKDRLDGNFSVHSLSDFSTGNTTLPAECDGSLGMIASVTWADNTDGKTITTTSTNGTSHTLGIKTIEINKKIYGGGTITGNSCNSYTALSYDSSVILPNGPTYHKFTILHRKYKTDGGTELFYEQKGIAFMTTTASEQDHKILVSPDGSVVNVFQANQSSIIHNSHLYRSHDIINAQNLLPSLTGSLICTNCNVSASIQSGNTVTFTYTDSNNNTTNMPDTPITLD